MNLDDLELADDATGILLEDFGVTDLDVDLTQGDDLVFDMQDIEDELTFDDASGEEEEALSAATILDAQVDVVQTLRAHVVEANKSMEIFASDSSDARQEEILFKVDQSEFSFVPADVFAVLQSIIVDAVQGSDGNSNVFSLAEQAIVLLKEATGWAPGVYHDDFISAYCKWFSRLLPLTELSMVSCKPRLAAIVDEHEVENALRIFSLNTSAFVEINNIFSDAAVRGSTEIIDLPDFLIKTLEFKKERRIRNFAVKDAYEFIAGYFADNEIISMLKISQDERLSFSLGELVRRLALTEIQQGLVDQTVFRQVSKQKITSSCIQALASMASDGSVVAEMFCLTTLCILASRKAPAGMQFPQECIMLLLGITDFYVASLEQEALVNPVFFSRVTAGDDDSDYKLEFVVGGEVFSLPADTPLCEVLGDGATTYCVPYVLLDRKHGCSVCAPGTLFTALREASSKSRHSLPSGSCFRFMPTTSWMMEHGVLADSFKASEECDEQPIGSAQFSSLLQALMQYDNAFDSSGSTVDVMRVHSKSAELYSVVDAEKVNASVDVAIPIHGSEDGYFTGGFITKDLDKGTLLLQLECNNGSTSIEEIADAEDVVEFLAPTNQAHQEAAALTKLSLFFVGQPAGELPGWQSIEQSARVLCDMFALDYQDELRRAQHTIAGDLYTIVGVHMLGDAVATKLMGDYLARAEEGGKLDGFNLTTLKELADIIAGAPNELTAKTAWDSELPGIIENLIHDYGVTLQAVVRRLDAVNLKLLALQHIVGGHSHREPAMAEYLAFREVPGVRSRMSALENYMVMLAALSVQGEQASILFEGRSYYTGILKHPIVANKVAGLEQFLGEKAHVKAPHRTGLLALSSAVVKQASEDDSSLLKYFILERNLPLLLSSAKSNYPALVTQLESACNGADPSSLDEAQTATTMRKCKEQLVDVVYAGIAQEAQSSGLGYLVAEFDLICSFPEDILGVTRDSASQSIAELPPNFFSYAGSFLVSYCMVFGESAGDIDSGVTRDLAFAQSPDDFYIGAGDSLLFLRAPEYQIQDLHTWDTEGE